MKKGFTLIELLVVVLIIGILSAIALPQYTKAVEKSRTGEALLTLKHAQQARYIEYLQNSSFDNASDVASDIMELNSGTWDSDGLTFCTKHFMYGFDDPAYSYAYRVTPNADCTDNTDLLYTLKLPTLPEPTETTCFAYTDVGYAICKSLTGFNVDDQR